MVRGIRNFIEENKPLLQVALDYTSLSDALRVASILRRELGGEGWLAEAGTPLIKSSGAIGISSLAAIVDPIPVVADTKTADTGALEVEIAAKSGASIATVLACADDTTIREAVGRAHELGLLVAVDTIGLKDPVKRVEELEAQKRKIEQEIEAIENHRDIRFDSSRIKEHYMQIEEMVRKLKYDFSEIEYNFRRLNSEAMEKIALASAGKGEVLDSIFAIEDDIRESDQGKSFFAFWQLLSDVQSSERLAQLLEDIYRVDEIQELDSAKKLKDLKFSLLKNGEKVYGVSSKLIEQLRRFLDDRVWAENRRILELSKKIEKEALEIKEDAPKAKNFISLAGYKVTIDSIFSKSLFSPKEEQLFTKELRDEEITLDMESFYDIFYVDETLLAQNIQKLLLEKDQVRLSEVIAQNPIKKGVAELVGYISLAKRSESVLIDEKVMESVVLEDSYGKCKKIALPKIIFVREE